MRQSRVLVLSCLVVGYATSAHAQNWLFSPSIEAGATLTNNANYDTGAEREADLIFNVAPGIAFSRDGPRLRVNGSASLNVIGYANGTQSSRILPQAGVLANLEAVERFFFIEAALQVDQEVLNPFLPQSEESSTFNKYTYAQASIAPYLQGTLGGDWRYLVRSDNSYTNTSQAGAALSDSYYGRHAAEIVRLPTPFGTSLRLQRDITRFTEDPDADQRLDVVRATINYAFTPQFIVGLRGGYERTNYTTEEDSGPIYGADLAWSLNPRTRLSGFWESRFFGSSYEVGFSNRQRLLATSISASRLVSTFPELLLRLPATGNVSSLLNSILIAQYPDPIERARQVQDLITRRVLPSSLPGAVNIYTQSVNVLTSGSATVALIGVRNTLALNIYYTKTRALPDATIPPSFLVLNDNIQKGAFVSFTHRLTPVTSLNALAGRRETRGLDKSTADISDEDTVQVQMAHQLSPRTSAFIGARYQRQDSTSGSFASVIRDSNEAAIFIGVAHQR